MTEKKTSNKFPSIIIEKYVFVKTMALCGISTCILWFLNLDIDSYLKNEPYPTTTNCKPFPNGSHQINLSGRANFLPNV